MGNANDIAAVEKRAETAGYPMRDVCTEAGVHLQSWSRAKGRGRITEGLLERVTEAMDRLEAARAEAA